jgi:hypothetical protein
VGINNLTTNLNLNLLEEGVANTTTSTRAPSDQVGAGSIGKRDLYIGLPDEICIAIHNCNKTLTIGGRR